MGKKMKKQKKYPNRLTIIPCCRPSEYLRRASRPLEFIKISYFIPIASRNRTGLRDNIIAVVQRVYYYSFFFSFIFSG